MLLSHGKINSQISFTNYTTLYGLADNFVSGGVCVDANNVKYFGTQAGLSKFDGVNWTNLTSTDGLVDNYINCVAADNAGNIWIGTSNGLSKFNGTTFQNFTTEQGLPDNSINHIAIDISGNIWIATYSGLVKYNGTDFTTYTTSNGLSSDLITYVLPVGTNVWMGTIGGGVAKYDGLAFTAINSVGGLPDDNPSCLAVDSEGKIWVGTYSGIGVIGTLGTIVATYTMANELLNNYVQDIAIDEDDNVVVLEFADYLTEGGVTLFDGTTWHTYLEADGLIDILVKRVEFDDDGYAWITTGEGISRMSLGAGSVSQYLPANENVYPNPTSDFFIIANADDNLSYSLTDLSGRIVSQESNVSSDRISINNLPSGIYLLMYQANGNYYTARISKE